MRRIIKNTVFVQNSNEHGAVSVITAIMMVALLGFAAIAIDVGMMYSERAQLQNGADSAAMAVANNCAKGACGPYGTTAGALANLNAVDGKTKTDSVTFPAPGSVKVDVSSRDAAGDNFIRLAFANIFGISTTTVGATATASWGGVSSGVVPFPITFSDCQFDLSGEMQLLQYHQTGAQACGRGASGLIIPGGFGWLVQDSGTCTVTINLNSEGGIVGSRTGTSPPSGCDTILSQWKSKINAGQPPVAFFPVYDGESGSGSGGTFHIRGFAAFEVHGWKFTGSDSTLEFNNTGFTPSSLNCTGSCRGIVGKFVRYVALDSAFTPGGPNLGLSVIQLTQ